MDMDLLTEDPDVRAATQVIADASANAMGASHDTLWTTLVPRALRPIAWPLLALFPTKQLRRLRDSRSKLYGVALVLAKNAMKRLGLEWEDTIGMEEAFGGCKGG